MNKTRKLIFVSSHYIKIISFCLVSKCNRMIFSQISALSLVATLFLALMCFHISYLRASKYHTIKSILQIYIMKNILKLSYGRVMQKFNKRAKNPRYAQEIFLKERMQRDAKTVYGKQHDFSSIKCLEDLRKKHPLTSYAHYEEYVQRMADGEKDVLICEKVERFGITSGTTGKGKLIPLPNSRFGKFRRELETMWRGAIVQRIGFGLLQKAIINYVNPKQTKTASGDVVGPFSSFTMFADNMKRVISPILSAPWEVLSISTEHEAQYMVLLFGLRDANIGLWFGPFSSQVHKAMSRLEKHWQQLVHDIQTGTIDKDLKITAEAREACMKELTPEPERAEELKREFEKGFDGIMRRVWPHLIFIWGINTSNYTEKLRNEYANGKNYIISHTPSRTYKEILYKTRMLHHV